MIRVTRRRLLVGAALLTVGLVGCGPKARVHRELPGEKPASAADGDQAKPARESDNIAKQKQMP